jgi:hypothetical protein
MITHEYTQSKESFLVYSLMSLPRAEFDFLRCSCNMHTSFVNAVTLKLEKTSKNTGRTPLGS